MSTVTLRPDAQGFPVGTLVRVYEEALPNPDSRLAGKPAGAEVTSATVAAGGTLALAGLAPGHSYVGWASVGGADSYVRFSTDEVPPSAVTDSSGYGTFDWGVLKEAPLNVKWAEYGAKGDGATDDTVALQTAINACQGDLYLPASKYLFSKLTMRNNVRLMGDGEGATSLIATAATGNVLDFTGVSFSGVSDLLLRPSVLRTAGALIYLNQGEGSCQKNRFERLRVASPYVGFQFNDCTNNVIDQVQFFDYNAAWGNYAGIWLSGRATGSIVNRLKGGFSPTTAQALVYLSGGTIDTFHAAQWDILGLSGKSMVGLLAEAGQWIKLASCSIESGGSNAVTVAGAHNVTLTDPHLLGFRGLEAISGNCVSIEGGEVAESAREACALSGGAHHYIRGLTVNNPSASADGTYAGISVAANLNNFTILGNVIGQDLRGVGGGSQPKYGIEVLAGTSDHYVIESNRVTSFLTAGISDRGTGMHKSVTGNVE